MNFEIIHKQLEEEGYVEIENFLTIDQINKIKKFVNIKKNNINKNNFSLANQELDDPVFNEIIFSKEVENLSKNLLNEFIDDYSQVEKHFVLGVIKNEVSTIKKQNVIFHFDAYFLTINIPITMPNKKISDIIEEQSGNLLILPNFRKFGNSLLKNLIFKILFQNFITRFFLSFKTIHKLLKIKSINLSNSKIYIFYGYRTLHGVDRNFAKGERTTFLIHVHNPHKDSFFDRYIKKKHLKQRTISRKKH